MTSKADGQGGRAAPAAGPAAARPSTARRRNRPPS